MFVFFIISTYYGNLERLILVDLPKNIKKNLLKLSCLNYFIFYGVTHNTKGAYNEPFK